MTISLFVVVNVMLICTSILGLISLEFDYSKINKLCGTTCAILIFIDIIYCIIYLFNNWNQINFTW